LRVRIVGRVPQRNLAVIQRLCPFASPRVDLCQSLVRRRQHAEAIVAWERAAELDPKFATVWRNLGIAYFNVSQDSARAAAAFERAWNAAPNDARVLYERDQLWKRRGVAADHRRAELQRYHDLVALRDDLSVEMAALLNQTGRYEDAARLLSMRQFQPWEGGEGLALAQHVRTYLGLGRRALCEGDVISARHCFVKALEYPENLGEARHLLANASNVHYWLGVAAGDEGRDWLERAAAARGDFQEMSVRAVSDMTYYSARALERLGRAAEARDLARGILAEADHLANTEPKIDYFATSLPAMLLFHEDLRRRNRITCRFLEAQARIALGENERGRALLNEVMHMDPSHAGAADLVDELACEEHISQAEPEVRA
jgi:tetratricopeptide (TPR) repeat protein